MTQLIHPVEHGMSITPDDDNDLSTTARAVYLGASGNLKVTLSSGDTVTFVGLAAGVIHPIVAKRIWATGTTATGILAFYN